MLWCSYRGRAASSRGRQRSVAVLVSLITAAAAVACNDRESVSLQLITPVKSCAGVHLLGGPPGLGFTHCSDGTLPVPAMSGWAAGEDFSA